MTTNRRLLEDLAPAPGMFGPGRSDTAAELVLALYRRPRPPTFEEVETARGLLCKLDDGQLRRLAAEVGAQVHPGMPRPTVMYMIESRLHERRAQARRQRG